MNAASQTLLLLKMAKAVRRFANGILIVAFFQHFFVKNVGEPAIVMVQICTFFGTLIVSYILGANQQKIGSKTTLLLGSLVMLITAISLS